MNRFAFVALLLPLVAAAEPKDALPGDWWGTIAERRVSFAADGTYTEFRPTDAEERKGTWQADGDKVTIRFEGRKSADVFTFAVEGDELTLTEPDGRASRLKKEARADREKRLGDMLEDGVRKRRASEEEPDQFARQKELDEARDLARKVEPLVRSLAGADREKQKAYIEGLLKARDPGLLDGPGGEAPDVKPRESEPPSAKRNCANHLKQLGVYFALFESKFRRYPKTMDEIKAPNLLTDEKLLFCPADTGEDAKPYVYVPPTKGDETPPDAVMAYERVPHADGTRNVLFFQGRVQAMNDADFRKALAASGGTFSFVPGRSKEAKAWAEAKDGKVLVTVRAKIVGLKAETVDGKERIRARVSARAVLKGGDEKPVDSGVRVLSEAPVADGIEVVVTVILPVSNPDRLDSVVLLVDDRVAACGTGETWISGQDIVRPK